MLDNLLVLPATVLIGWAGFVGRDERTRLQFGNFGSEQENTTVGTAMTIRLCAWPMVDIAAHRSWQGLDWL